MLKENWFIGEGSLIKLDSLSSTLQNSQLTKNNRNSFHSYEKFQSWMAFEQFWGKAIKIPSLRKQTHRICLDETRLNELKNLFTSEANIAFFKSNDNTQVEIKPLIIDHHFVQRMQSSLNIIGNVFPLFHKLYRKTVMEIVPTSNPWSLEGFIVGSTITYLPGTLFIGLTGKNDQEAVYRLALTIVHELAHNFLNILGYGETLINDDLTKLTYSGVRKTQRPCLMSFHSAAALTYLAAYCLDYLTSKFDSRGNLFHYNRLNGYADALKYTLDDLADVRFILLGNKVMTEMRSIETKSNDFLKNIESKLDEN